jgi:glycosyltransferase involved in cell wall biosynthesis
MNILITGLSMNHLSGQPLYCYELARALKKQGHNVSVMSSWKNPVGDGRYLINNLSKEGIICLDWDSHFALPDLLIASEQISQGLADKLKNKAVVINVVHSEYSCETPLDNVDGYVCIRPSILEHIVAEHGKDRSMCRVVYNGVDRERFKPRVKTERSFHKIVIPCTIDRMREKFLNFIIDEAFEEANSKVFIFGKDHGAQLKKIEDVVVINPDRFDIEKEIADADLVAGILLGRVNLEARSCGVPSIMVDPETLEMDLFEISDDEFDHRHNIINVANQLIKFYDDIICSKYSCNSQCSTGSQSKECA